MSQENRVIEGISGNNPSCNDKQRVQPNKPVVKKTAKKRGRINVNACYRCRRDKKKCDGNYSTMECCRYCRHHKVECTYPEPGRRRVKPGIEVKETRRIKKIETRKNPIKEIQERMIKVEENLFDVTELLANVHQPNIKYLIQQIFFRLLFNESTTIERTLLLRRFWTLINKIINYPTCNEEYLCALYEKLQLLENDQEEIRSHMWKEIQSFIDEHNDNKPSSLTQAFNSEAISQYAVSSLHISKSPLPQPQTHSHIQPGFELSLENICAPTFNVNTETTIQVINDPLISQTTYGNKRNLLPIVPSQHSQNDDNQNLKQEDYQGGTSLSIFQNEVVWTGINNSFTFNNYNLSSNLMPYIESPRTFSTNMPHNNNTQTTDNETNHFQHLINEETNFFHYHSTMSSPLFPDENCNTPTFNSLQSSPSLHPLNEIEHSYGMLSPTNSMTGYRR